MVRYVAYLLSINNYLCRLLHQFLISAEILDIVEIVLIVNIYMKFLLVGRYEPNNNPPN